MSFYIRKAFRVGPLRLNLSKSGLGLSAGVTGARVGIGPKGAYVHGGRHGLYYRKYASSKGWSSSQRTSGAQNEVEHFVDTGLTYCKGGISVERYEPTVPPVPAASPVYLILVVIGALLFLSGLAAGTAQTVAGLALLVSGIIINRRFQKQKQDLIEKLDLFGEQLKARESVEEILSGYNQIESAGKLRAWFDFHFFTLIHDSFYEDPNYISPDELLELEKQVAVPSSNIVRIKAATFSSFLDAVMEDHVISEDEEERLDALQKNLRLSDCDIQEERTLIDIMCSMRRAMSEELKAFEVDINLKTNENCFYCTEGRFLKQKTVKRYQQNLVKHKIIGYDIDMEGQIYLTDNRILMVGGGSRSYELKKIIDVTLSVEDNTVQVVIDGRKSALIITMRDCAVFTGKLKNLLAG